MCLETTLKVSIIIPTCDRSHYLFYSLQTVLEIKDDNIEIIVSDNYSGDNTKAIVEKFSDKRLKYICTDKRVSMRENFNNAALKSTGDYLIFFGDDDGILPKQFKYLRRAPEQYTPDGISWLKATYIWPNDESGAIFGGKKAGRIKIYGTRVFGQPFKYDPKEKHLENLMQCRLQYLKPTTPNIYHGCVSRAFLEKHASEKNVFFDSTIPDFNFQFRAILSGGNFIHINHIFSINGDSAASNGRAHHGYKLNDPRTKPAQKFHKENEKDTYLNIFGNHRFTPLLLMATLETVRYRLPSLINTPNLIEWFSYVFRQASLTLPNETYNIVVNSLEEYASETDSLKELNIAKLHPIKKNKKTWQQMKDRLSDNLSCLTLLSRKDGINNILTAVKRYDEILDNSYGQVLDNKKTSKNAWREAKSRAKKLIKKYNLY